MTRLPSFRIRGTVGAADGLLFTPVGQGSTYRAELQGFTLTLTRETPSVGAPYWPYLCVLEGHGLGFHARAGSRKMAADMCLDRLGSVLMGPGWHIPGLLATTVAHHVLDTISRRYTYTEPGPRRY